MVTADVEGDVSVVIGTVVEGGVGAGVTKSIKLIIQKLV